MNAMEGMFVAEKTRSNEANAGFLMTTTSRPSVCATLPLLRSSKVSRKATDAATTTIPRMVCATKVPLQEVIRNKTAPNIGATMGEITVKDCTSARVDSRFLPRYTSLTMAMPTALAAPAPRACRTRKTMSR